MRGSLVGKKFGEWTVMRKSKRRCGPHISYVCLCSCGRQKEIPATNLVSGKSTKCKSCQDDARRGSFKHRLAPVFSRVKTSASKRGIEFGVDHDYVLKVMENQGWRCALTGLPLKVEWRLSSGGHSVSSGSTASLDRIDSGLGYVVGNVQWVHKAINIMKWKLSQTEFINMCRLVVEKNNGK